MKMLIVLLLFPATVFAASWEAIRKEANDHFIGIFGAPTYATPESKTPVHVGFSEAISRVVVNRIDNPISKLDYGLENAGLLLMAEDKDDVEIFLYAGEESLNCYASFVNGEFHKLYNCSKKRP